MYRTTIGLLVICAVSVGVLAHHGPPPHIKAAMKKCIEEAGGDESFLEQMHHRESGENLDPKFRCVDACVMKKIGSMNEDGTTNKEKSIEDVPADVPHREKIVEALNICLDEKSDDECETGQRVHKCMGEQLMKKRPQ